MEQRERTPSPAAALSVAVLFLLVGLFGILNHEMWRDELEIWLIARDSASLGALLGNIGTQGHPILWYLLNFLLARFTDSPVAMQALHLLIATGGAFVVLRAAPFSQVQRILFCFGYLWLYEFTVISRSYGLVFLLIFLFLARLDRNGALTPLLGVILLLAANTHLYGGILGGCLSLAVLWALAARGGTSGSWVGLAIAWVGIAVGTGHVYLQRLAIGEAHLGVYRPGYDATWLAQCLSTVFRGYVPLPDPTSARFWNSNLLDALPGSLGPFIGALFSIALLALSLLVLRRREARLAFALGAASMLSITLFAWYGQLRQHAQIFMLFVVCLWLDRILETRFAPRPAPSARSLRPAASVALTSLLALQFVAAGYAYAMELARPFSNASRAGAYLRQPEFDDALLVGSFDYSAEPIAAYVPKRIYYPESGEFRTFLDWGPQRKRVGPQIVLEQAVELMRSRHREVLVVLCYELAELRPGETDALDESARMEYLARFDGAIVPDENYFVYRIYDLPTPLGG